MASKNYRALQGQNTSYETYSAFQTIHKAFIPSMRPHMLYGGVIRCLVDTERVQSKVGAEDADPLPNIASDPQCTVTEA